MTFLAYLAASTDRSAQLLAQDFSGLADGANDLGVVVTHLRSTLDGSEASLAVEEARYRWGKWNEWRGVQADKRPAMPGCRCRQCRRIRKSRESSP